MTDEMLFCASRAMEAISEKEQISSDRIRSAIREAIQEAWQEASPRTKLLPVS